MTHSPIASPKATQELLERHGITPSKSFGQNFLIDDNVVGRILELSGASADDVIVEIGPGIGTLTSALLASSGGVVAIEKDSSLPPVLRDTLGDQWDKLNLIESDALNVRAADLAYGRVGDTTFLPTTPKARIAGARRFSVTRPVSERLYPNKLVANLPYSVAATIVLDYFQRFDFIESMTVMVQKEVAMRMKAQPGSKDYGAYTVKLALYADPAGDFDVSRNCFIPAPHVDSMVIRLDRKKPSMFAEWDGDPGSFNGGRSDSAAIEQPSEIVESESPGLLGAACMMADAAFASRRKTIANSMKSYFAGRQSNEDAFDPAGIPQLLEDAGIDPGIRGECVAPSDYLRLASCFLKLAG